MIAPARQVQSSLVEDRPSNSLSSSQVVTTASSHLLMGAFACRRTVMAMSVHAASSLVESNLVLHRTL